MQPDQQAEHGHHDQPQGARPGQEHATEALGARFVTRWEAEGGGEALGGVGFVRGGADGVGDVRPECPDEIPAEVPPEAVSWATAAVDAARRRVTCVRCFGR